MMMKSLQELLDSNDIEYELIHHRRDFRARDTASDTHTEPGDFAKTIVLEIDDQICLAVLPATHFLSISKLERSLGADDIRMLEEREIASRCPDSEVGAVPPFGSLFGLPVYVCPTLTKDEKITFNAGTHSDAVRMSYAEYERLEKPTVAAMAKHEEER